MPASRPSMKKRVRFRHLVLKTQKSHLKHCLKSDAPSFRHARCCQRYDESGFSTQKPIFNDRQIEMIKLNQSLCELPWCIFSNIVPRTQGQPRGCSALRTFGVIARENEEQIGAALVCRKTPARNRSSMRRLTLVSSKSEKGPSKMSTHSTQGAPQAMQDLAKPFTPEYKSKKPGQLGGQDVPSFKKKTSLGNERSASRTSDNFVEHHYQDLPTQQASP